VAGLGFETRLLRAWIAAGRPTRSAPDYEGLFSPDSLAAYGRRSWLTSLAADALGVARAITMSSSFARAKFPGDDASSMPWHQDAQCVERVTTVDFVTAWIPLVDVPARNPCLELAPTSGTTIFEPTWSDRYRYFFMHPSDVDRLSDRRPVSLRRGDLLLMGKHVPHRSLPNLGTTIRWSADFRLMPTGW
jgi:ectoine hydroxylase-related dioxygenase (phytanoyl-CoA dioxygenase family)